MKRHKISSRSGKRSFSHHASMTHRKNLPGSRLAMRGGIRL